MAIIKQTSLTAIFTNSTNKPSFVGVWTEKTTDYTFDYELQRIKGVKVASASSDEVYECTQHPHSHSCTCKGSRWTSKWHKEAMENGTTPKTCKHVAALIAAGVFTAPPVKHDVGTVIKFMYETDNIADLQMIDGKLCVPVAKTGGKIVEVTCVLAQGQMQLA